MSAAGTDERLAAACARAADVIGDEFADSIGTGGDMPYGSAIAAIIQREIAPLFAEAAADAERMDYLECERKYEERGRYVGIWPLFRRNYPITREDIDKVRNAVAQ